MPHSQLNNSEIKLNFASMIRGLYGRVARKANVDPSYVSRVARGERRSDRVEASLERELKRIVALANGKQNGASRKHHA
jgi:hypothetical protein